MSGLSFIILLVLGVGTVGLGFLASIFHKTLRGALIVLCGIFAIATILVPFSIKQVNTGEIAVVTKFGKVKETRTEGVNFDLWIFNQYHTYDLKTQEISQEIAAYSSDAQTMEASLTIQYRIQADKAKEIYREYGELEVLEERITNLAIEKSKVVLASQSAMQIIENRESLSSDLSKELNKAINSYYIDITLAIITNIDFSDTFEKVVEDKMVAEQEKLKAEYEKEKAIIQAEQELEVAKKQAEAEIAKAEGDAEAQIAIAEAQAEVIRLKSLEIAQMMGFEVKDNQIVTEGKSAAEVAKISEYLKYMEYLNVWDGKLPNVVTGTDGNIIVGIGG